MPLTYEDSVLEAADNNGNLSHADAQKLLAEHGFTLDDTYADNHGVSWMALDERNAEALLAWLGYSADRAPNHHHPSHDHRHLP